MRDDDLLDLIDRAALEDLTPDECAAIRAAAESSPEIRRACLARIGLEEHLATTLGRPRVSVDDLLARRRRFVDSRFAGGWMAPLLIGLLVAAVVVAAAWIRHRGVEETPRSDGPVEVAAAMNAATTDDTAPLPGDATASTPEANDSTTPPETTRGDVETTVVMQPEGPADETEPRGPWTAALAVGQAEPTVTDLFRWIPPRQVDQSELQTWFRAKPAAPLKFAAVPVRGIYGMTTTSVTGTMSLVPPLREGTSLRLLLLDPGDLRIVAWAGNAGAAIEREGPAEGPRWCGSVLTRPAAGQPVSRRWLASTSDGRGLRSGVGVVGSTGFLGILEVRYVDGALVLSRGDIRLAEAPLPGPPDEVLFEGAMTIAGIELVRAVPPRPLPQPPSPTATWRPADQDWTGSGAATLETRPDGSVHLAQRDAAAKTPLIASWKVPPAEAGPRDILLRIADHTPGTGICITGTDGKTAVVCGFVDPVRGGPTDRIGSLFMTWTPDKSPLVGGDPRNLGLAFAPPSLWLRLTSVDASVVVSWSHDGRRWARLRTFPAATQGLAEVGLFVGGSPGRTITLAELAAAELPGFAAVLRRDCVDAVNPLLATAAAEKRVEGWRAKMLAAKPANVDERGWLAAAAIRFLATQPTTLTLPLGQVVWQYVRSLDLPPDEVCAVFDDINRLTTAPLKADLLVLNGLYGTVAQPSADRGDAAGFERAWLRLEEAPSDIVGHVAFDFEIDPLHVRDRLLRRSFADGLTREFREHLSRLRFRANDTGLPGMMTRAAETGSPIFIESANSLVNAVAEFDVAVEARAWSDAQRAIAGLAAGGGDALHDLLEHPRDPDRLVTMPALVAEALAAHADFAAFMRGDPAARGRLRVAQLRSAGDAVGMSVAALEFEATPAAAEARAWLAERALAAGDFLAARKHAHIGLDSAAPEQRAALVSIRSLAEALAGLAVAEPPRSGVGMLPAAEIAALVSAEVARRGADLPATANAVQPSAVAPPAAALEAVKRADLGPARQGTPAIDWPASLTSPFFPHPPFFLHRLDWSAEVCGLAPVGGRLLASNRQEIIAVDAATGAVSWRVPAGPNPCELRSHALVPFRPVCDAEHAYARRMPTHKNPPTLACIRLADGTIAWELPSVVGAPVISDPVLLEGTLWACEVRTAFADELLLVAFDPRTGARRFTRTLCRLLPAWRTSRSGANTAEVGDCQLAVADGRLVVTVGGSVICCAADGHPLWVRRQPWAGSQGDPWWWWWFQAQSPAVARDGTLFIVQPGVAACTAIELATGRLIWRTPLPLVRRLVGIAGKEKSARIVVETGDGIVALHPGDGAVTTLLDGRDGPGDPWLGIAPTRLMAAAIATTDGHAVVAVQTRRPPDGTTALLDTSVVWIDVASGTLKRTVDLPALAGQPPWVGPMAASGDRLWVLTASKPNDLRRTLWELAPQP